MIVSKIKMLLQGFGKPPLSVVVRASDEQVTSLTQPL